MFNKDYIKKIGGHVCDNMTLTIAISTYFAKYMDMEYPLNQALKDENISTFDVLCSLPREICVYGVELINRKKISYQLFVCVLGAYFTDVLNEAHK